MPVVLTTRLIHPDILAALARAGHGSKVLLADGNYPAVTKLGPNAELVHLNIARGLVGVLDVLEPLVATIPVEQAEVMVPPDGPEPAIFADFRRIIGDGVELTKLDRFAFYDAAGTDAVALTIQTGEQRQWANLLLTIGVVPGQW